MGHFFPSRFGLDFVFFRSNPHGVLVFLVLDVHFLELLFKNWFFATPTACTVLEAFFSVLFVVSFLNPNVDFLRKPLKTSIRLALGLP